MNKYFVGVVFLISFIVSLGSQEINFNRQHRTGTIFDAKIAATFVVDCELIGKASDKREVRKKKNFLVRGENRNTLMGHQSLADSDAPEPI